MIAPKFVAVLGIASLALVLPAAHVSAASERPPVDKAATPGLDKRTDNQQRRLDQGTESGRLTEREANRLVKRQEKIQGDVTQAKSDGVVDRAERRQIHRELNRSSRATARQGFDLQNDFDRDGKADRPRK